MTTHKKKDADDDTPPRSHHKKPAHEDVPAETHHKKPAPVEEAPEAPPEATGELKDACPDEYPCDHCEAGTMRVTGRDDGNGKEYKCGNCAHKDWK